MADKTRILVVDDELPVCKSVTGSLEGDQYVVDMALSAEEALKKQGESPYEVIITDLMMPGLSGMDLLEKVKDSRPGTSVIMITGYPSIKSAVESIKLGAFDYIPKPFTPNDLRSLVARAVESMRYHERERKGTGEDIAGITAPGDLLCIPENSWVRVDERGEVRIGIHHVFVRTIGEIRTIELPQEGEMRYQGEACVRIIDSSDHVHKVWTPVSGRIIAVNQAVVEDYSRLVADPYDEGWLMALTPTNLEGDIKNLVPGTGA
jgi:CheY-like chemotaxis protein/glycine cleavage system H lipoate-binding protein